MIERNSEEKEFCNGTIGKFLRNRHILLLYLGEEEDNGNKTTVIHVKQAFRIKNETSTLTKGYAWTLLENLKDEGLIKKSTKISIDGQEYSSWVLTKQARYELKILASSLRRFGQL